jgi:hypothetical protein
MSASVKLTRGTIILGALMLYTAWTWRPLPAVGGAEPFFAGNLPHRSQAIAAADSLFQLTGIPIDTMRLDAPGTLVVVVAPSALMTPVRMVDGSCQGGDVAWFVMHRLGVQLDALYGAPRLIQLVQVRTQQFRASASGWGWRRWCGHGGASVGIPRRELDSLHRTAG